MIKSELHERVIKKIKDRTKTQRDIARDVGFTEVTICKIMKGVYVSDSTLELIDLKLND